MTDLKVIEHLGRHVQDAPIDFTVHVRVDLSVPQFLDVAFITLHGGREWFVFAVRCEDDADRILRDGHPDINKGTPLLQHPRFVEAAVVGGTRKWVRK